ncbi:MAG: hypothetical protein R3B54_08280 [Bdellovibrionota bacterium]
MGDTIKTLVNPSALAECVVTCGDLQVPLLDLSMVRLVVPTVPAWETLGEGEALELKLNLGSAVVSVSAVLQTRGSEWLRFGLVRVVPSARARLRSFLSPKKIGESLRQDWTTETSRHFHGLNESELWFDTRGGLLFTYLDQENAESQFILHIRDRQSGLSVGTMPRPDYIELNGVEEPLPLRPIKDGEVYPRVSECRDIVTNFRPVGQKEFQLKQRLLQVISEYLYNTRRGIERSFVPASARNTTAPTAY